MLRAGETHSRELNGSAEVRELHRMIHRTIKKVTDDIEGRFHFNTAIAAIMELFNALSIAASRDGGRLAAPVIRTGMETIIQLLYPFVPHLMNELWQNLNKSQPLDQKPWPEYSPEALEEEQLLIVLQVNGKVRGKMTVPAGIQRDQVETDALAEPRIKALIDGKTVQRIVYVPRNCVLLTQSIKLMALLPESCARLRAMSLQLTAGTKCFNMNPR
jgi:leucyl-tRNA synthetase